MKHFRMFLYVLIAAVIIGGAAMIACNGTDTGTCAGLGEKCGASTSDNRACCEHSNCNNHGIGQGWVCEDY